MKENQINVLEMISIMLKKVVGVFYSVVQFCVLQF